MAADDDGIDREAVADGLEGFDAAEVMKRDALSGEELLQVEIEVYAVLFDGEMVGRLTRSVLCFWSRPVFPVLEDGTFDAPQ